MNTEKVVHDFVEAPDTPLDDDTRAKLGKAVEELWPALGDYFDETGFDRIMAVRKNAPADLNLAAKMYNLSCASFLYGADYMLQECLPSEETEND